MPRSVRLSLLIAPLLATFAAVVPPLQARQAGNDLDQFMAAVLDRRDDNWRKLRQYVLDERETAAFLGPGRVRLYALERDYTWFIREGIFVRSPLRFDGVALSDGDRRKAEQEWIDQERAQQKNRAAAEAAARQGAAAPQAEGPTSVDAILRSTREPQFVSSSYFLRFKFEPGHYAFVGPETYNGRQVLRIEYYPRHMYDDDGESWKDKTAKKDGEAATEERVTRQMNKTVLVTLWVEPTEHQIVQYRFDNMPLDFLPARSLVRIEGFGATMKMGQPFKDVWLPAEIDATGRLTLATGTFDVHYAVSYHEYRQADVQVKIR